SVMEIVPRAFPSLFPPSGADQASGRALWLALMGTVQIVLGFGFIIRTQVIPAALRILSAVPAAGTGSLALPSPRGVTSR
ncbi:MAG TPA: hypothetical protein VII09_10955, partial [Opitutaceae bacterium]